MRHLAGHKIRAGCGYSTVLPNMDFETYSEIGYAWVNGAPKALHKSSKKGGMLGVYGAAAYSEHPSTEALMLAYDLKDGNRPHLWVPRITPIVEQLSEVAILEIEPVALFDHLRRGEVFEAHNSGFEFRIWNNVCVPKYGWPILKLEQLRDSAAKARVCSLPSSLADLGNVLNIDRKKYSYGKNLINRFSIPQKPTKTNGMVSRIRPDEDSVYGVDFYRYCLRDIEAESDVSELLPDLSPEETENWLLNQRINTRGVAVDEQKLSSCLDVMDKTFMPYEAELFEITNGKVTSINQFKALATWLTENGAPTNSVDEENINRLLADKSIPDPSPARRVLTIRKILAYSSVKKAVAIRHRVNRRMRLEELYEHYGARRTGREAGRGPQPQNLPKSGPEVIQCDVGCGHFYGADKELCPWCGIPSWMSSEKQPWSFDAVEDALYILDTRSLEIVERYFGDPLAVISGCLRSLLIAEEGRELICSDFSAIEAVALAFMAREPWRMEVFNTHGKIYEMSASKITGVPFEEFLRYKKETRNHHPLRKKVGKVAELASGYRGWISAWKRFGADEFFKNDDEMSEAILKWRAASPMIVRFWNKVQDAAQNAIRYPGKYFSYNDFSYACANDVLYCMLPSGRTLQYWQPRLEWEATPWGKQRLSIEYSGWNTDRNIGPYGWIRMRTHGGKLTENNDQAICRDILFHAMRNLEVAGYPVVMDTHDEIIGEIPWGFGSVREFETIMSTMPEWCYNWPIKAAGGWRGVRYRKAD